MDFCHVSGNMGDVYAVISLIYACYRPDLREWRIQLFLQINI